MSDTNVDKPGTDPAEKKKKTPEEFITRSPLYVVEAVDNFNPPDPISFVCDGKCQKETTWSRVYGPESVKQDFSIRYVAYQCGLCQQKRFLIVYRVMKQEKRPAPVRYVSTRVPGSPYPPPSEIDVVVAVMKVGQYPEPSVDLPKGLEKNLGKDGATLYRKALICRNSGYGLAAAGYIRRVVEDKTNELIEIAAQLAESHDVGGELVARMRQIGSSTEYTRYEDKLQVAATVFPDSLRVGGMNPLKMLYALVSKGIHSLDEAACVEIADQTTGVFDYIFTNLRAQIADKKTYVEKFQKLSALS